MIFLEKDFIFKIINVHELNCLFLDLKVNTVLNNQLTTILKVRARNQFSNHLLKVHMIIKLSQLIKNQELLGVLLHHLYQMSKCNTTEKI